MNKKISLITVFTIVLSVWIHGLFYEKVFLDKVYQVTGISMYPTLKEGDKLKIISREYKDGDIVVADTGTERVVKRVQGSILVGDNRDNTVIFDIDEVKIIGKAERYFGTLEDKNIQKVEAASYKNVYYTSQNGGLAKIRMDKTGDTTVIVNGPSTSQSIISPDGQWIYYTSPPVYSGTVRTPILKDMYLSRKKLDGTVTENLVKVKGVMVGTDLVPTNDGYYVDVYTQYSTSIALSPDGQWIYYTATNGYLRKIKLNGTEDSAVINSDTTTFNSFISPDNQWIYYTEMPITKHVSTTPTTIYLKRKKLDGSLTENFVQIKGEIIRTGYYNSEHWEVYTQFPNGVALSPDKQWIYYTAPDGALKKIRLDKTGDTIVIPATLPTITYNCQISPDGQWIYYTNMPKFIGIDQSKAVPVYIARRKLDGSITENFIQNKYEIVQSGALTGYNEQEYLEHQTPFVIPFNELPTVNIVTPTVNQILKETDTAFVPSISVLDVDNNNLTCKYYIDSETSPRDTKTVTSTLSTKTVLFNSLNISTLADGSHTIKYEVNDGFASSFATANIKVDKSGPILSSVIFKPTATTINVSGSASDSISGLSPVPFRYTVGSNVSSWLTATSYLQSSLTANTAYTVKFEARDTIDHISYMSQTVYTLAALPTAAVSNPTSTTLDLTVSDANPSTTEYQIMVGSFYVTSTGVLSTSPSWLTLTDKKITVTGLSPTTTYSIKVQARNGAGVVTGYSTTVSGTTLVAPPAMAPVVTAMSATNSITLSWTAVDNAIAYDVIKDGVEQDNVTSPYVHSLLSSNTTHTYQVRARNEGGTGPWCDELWATTLPDIPAMPTGLTAAPTGTTVKLTWDPSTGATGYKVKLPDNSIINTTQTSYTQTGLNYSTDYIYSVCAYNAGGDSPYTGPLLVTTMPNAPSTPVITSSTPETDKITVVWAPVTGSVEYTIKVDGIEHNVGTGVSYTHLGLRPGTQHTYSVCASNAGGTSLYSPLLTTATMLERPTNLTASSTSTRNTLRWSPVENASSYDIDKTDVNGNTVTFNTSNTYYIDSSLQPSTQYTYRVKAKNSVSEGKYCDSLTKTTLPYTPNSIVTLEADAGKDSITVSWNNVPDITGYDIEVDGVVINAGLNTSFIHDGLVPNTIHTYRVRVRNTGGKGVWCDLLTKATLPDAPNVPANIRARASDDEITVAWDPVTDASEYIIEVDGSESTTVTDSVYNHTDLTRGSTHTYKVRSISNGEPSEYSAMITVSAQDIEPSNFIPENLRATVTQNSIITVWDAVYGADSYDVMVDGGEPITVTDSVYGYEGFSPNTSHAFKVRAKNSDQIGDWSEELIAVTKTKPMNIPGNLTTAAVTDSGITVTWDQTEDAMWYILEIDGAEQQTVTGNVYDHVGLSSGTQHIYRVKSIGIAGESDFGPVLVMSTLPGVPTVPQNITATASGIQITVSWEPVAGADSYEIQIDGDSENFITVIDPIYIHEGLQPSTQHIYMVRAKNISGTSEWTEVLTKSTTDGNLYPPQNIRAVASDTSITLTWDSVPGATGYEVEVDGDSVRSSTTNSFVQDNLSVGSSHTFRIRSRNEDKVSEWSLSVKKKTSSTTYVMEVSDGDLFDIGLTASNVTDLSNTSFVLTYDPSQLEAVDFYSITPEPDLEVGSIKDANISISELTAGRVVFKVNGVLPQGLNWSGIISTVRFRAHTSGQANMTLITQ